MKTILFVLLCSAAQAQDTVKVYVTEWDFVKVTKDTTFTQGKAGLALLETPNNEDYEVTISYKKKVVVPVITVVEDGELNYLGVWDHPTGSWGSVSFSSLVGSIAVYNFYGKHIKVISDKANNHGTMGYKINNGLEKTVSLYSPIRQNGVIVIDEPVPLGTNSIQLRVLSGTVLIDKLIIEK